MLGCEQYVLRWLREQRGPVPRSQIEQAIAGAFGGISAVRGTVDQMVSGGAVVQAYDDRRQAVCLSLPKGAK